MSAAWIWARAELRARWRAWLLLGLLAGATVGVAAAGWAGARRTANAIPNYVAAAHVPTAALLVNDPAFGPEQRRAVARLPGVTKAYPFMVGVATEVFQPAEAGRGQRVLVPRGPGVDLGPDRPTGGRAPPRSRHAPTRSSSTRTLATASTSTSAPRWSSGSRTSARSRRSSSPRPAPSRSGRSCAWSASPSRCRATPAGSLPAASTPSTARTCPRSSTSSSISAAARRRSPRFTARVGRILGHPVNVEDTADLYGIRKARNVTDLERDGLLLFALGRARRWGRAGGPGARADGVGQRGRPADLARHRRRSSPGHARPRAPEHRHAWSVGALTTVVVAVALSSRFPLGSARDYDLDLGTHADWFVLGIGVVAVLVGLLAIAAGAAWWSINRRAPRDARPSVARSRARAHEPRPGPDDRRPAGGRARPRSARGAGALGPGGCGGRHHRCGGVLHVPRRDRGRGHPTPPFGSRVELRARRGRWAPPGEDHRRRRPGPRHQRRHPRHVAPRGAGRRPPGAHVRHEYRPR